MIADLLRTTRRRLALRHAAYGLSDIGIVTASAVLPAALLGTLLPLALLRAVLGAAFVAAIAQAAWRYGRTSRRHLRSDDWIASFLQRRLPASEGLVTAVQLQRDLLDEIRSRSMSSVLAEAAITAASERVQGAVIDGILPRKPGEQRLVALACVVAAWGFVAGVWPDTLSDGLHRLATGVAPAAEAEEVERAGEPVAGDITLTYRYPVYTAKPDRVIAGAAGDIFAVGGTVVDVRATALFPVRSASIVVTPAQGEAQTLPLSVEAGRNLGGQLTVTAPGKWRFSVVDTDGRTLEDGIDHTITVSEDHVPRVELVDPDKDLEVDADASIPLSFRVRDDYGIGSVSLIWQLVGTGEDPNRQSLPLEDSSTLEALGQHLLVLPQLGVRPGDRISLFVEATDNDTIKGPKVGVSATRLLRIRSPEDRHNQALATLKEVWEAMLDVLADRLEAEPPVVDSGHFAAIRDNVVARQESTVAILTSLAAVIETLEEDSLARKELYEGVRGLRGSLEDVMRKEEAALVRAMRLHETDTLRNSGLTALRAAGDENVTTLEQGILRLDELFQRQAVTDMQDLTKQLLAAQDRLRDLLQQYKKSPNLETKRRILREIQRLRDRIRELMAKIASLTKQVPLEHMNAGAGKDGFDEKAASFQSRLQEIEKLLAEGKIDEALAELERFANELQAMATELEQDATSMDKESETWKKEMAALQQGMQALQSEQKRVADETRAVDQAAEERVRAELEKKLEAFLEEQRQKVEELERALSEVPPELLAGRALEQLSSARRNVERLAGALDRRDLAIAREIADALVEQTTRLRGEVTWQTRTPRSRSAPWGAERARERAADSQRLAEGIRDDLRNLLPDQRHSEAEEQALERLAQRQQSLRDEAQRLGERMRGLEKNLPMQAGEMAEGLEQAGGHMERASDHLGGRRPRPAGEAQGQALSELDKAQQAMKDAMKQGRMGEQGQDSGANGRRNSRERVEIVSDHLSPKKFRDDVLDGMKRQSPAPYEEQNRRYYRELVK